MTTEPLVLDTEVLDPRPESRASRLVAVALVLAIVAVIVTWYADQRIRDREDGRVAACERLLNDASAHADVRLGAIVAILRPAAITTEGVQQLHLADLMASSARRVLPLAQRAQRVCGQVSVRPWHFSLVSRRTAATAYAGALVTLLQTVAAQGRGSFRDDSTLQRLRSAAGVQGPD
jgi:hypothetical protein